MKKVTCYCCLGTGYQHNDVHGERSLDLCSPCTGTGFVPVNKLKISIVEYEKEYLENYNQYNGIRKKEFKIINE